MSRRPYRPEMPDDLAAAVRALRACREAMIGISNRVRMNGPVSQQAHVVLAAIDALAAELTGDREYFWSIGSGATEGQCKAKDEKAARERGEIPWRK
ncbi:hypothetical protein Msil_2785 [Methylocella silvestris BL2]|uniref:Uncharacterized protein n=1 Tax=Methylocella silvestris (strain DSM 15510 / CIP 108128 / LMG 27833 / NCIMB 13906 / BL2) TaxID=395965 RepID=B8ES06_METSB|nr:hypothetical protein Msil_2785 [Methylocella silvestris BL2]